MTYDQLFAIARRRGFVQWHPSGVVEQLLVPKPSSKKFALFVADREERFGVHVWARSLLGNRQVHPIYPMTRDLVTIDFNCKEIARSEAVEVRLLFPRGTVCP